MKTVFAITVVAQTILHYLGWAGVVLGSVALLFGNNERGIELLIGGVGFIVLKYILGFIVHLILRTQTKMPPED